MTRFYPEPDQASIHHVHLTLEDSFSKGRLSLPNGLFSNPFQPDWKVIFHHHLCYMTWQCWYINDFILKPNRRVCEVFQYSFSNHLIPFHFVYLSQYSLFSNICSLCSSTKLQITFEYYRQNYNSVYFQKLDYTNS